MSEANSYAVFRANVVLVSDRVDRIENGVAVGMPDLSCCFTGHEFWLEIKSPTEPARPTTPLFGSNHKVSQQQANWMLRQRRAGGACFFLISTDVRWLLIGGWLADDINQMTVNALIEQCIWTTTKPVKDKQQWQHLRNALILHSRRQ